MKAEFIGMIQEIERGFPESKADVTPSSSSEAVMVHVVLNGTMFVFEYSPEYGYGVSELTGGPADWLHGHDEIFQKFEEAKKKLMQSVSAVCQRSHSPSHEN